MAATDLSSPGNGSVAWALALVPPDGTVTIVHGIEETEIEPKRRDQIAEGLRLMAVDRSLTDRRTAATPSR